MPPAAKFTKEQIIEAALNMVRKDGIGCLTARALGKMLKSSSCPIFTVFKNMEEVQKGVIDRAKALYKEYVKKGLQEVLAFKGVGKQYILFAINEPNLFQLLFMNAQETSSDLKGILPIIEESYEDILSSIINGYGLDRAEAEKLYIHLWIYTHGIATLCVTRTCNFTPQEISEQMSEVCLSLIKKMKEE